MATHRRSEAERGGSQEPQDVLVHQRGSAESTRSGGARKVPLLALQKQKARSFGCRALAQACKRASVGAPLNKLRRLQQATRSCASARPSGPR